MPSRTPHRTCKAATRAGYALAPFTVAAFAMYLDGGWWMTEPHARVLAQALLLATATAVIVAAVSAGQLAIANAFRAGYLSGLELGRAEQAAVDQRRLRVVPDTGTDAPHNR